MRSRCFEPDGDRTRPILWCPILGRLETRKHVSISWREDCQRGVIENVLSFVGVENDSFRFVVRIPDEGLLIDCVCVVSDSVKKKNKNGECTYRRRKRNPCVSREVVGGLGIPLEGRLST